MTCRDSTPGRLGEPGPERKQLVLVEDRERRTALAVEIRKDLIA